MSEPTSKDEFSAKVVRNTRVEGSGAGTRTVMACPFCGEPDWLIFPITAGLNEYRDVQRPTRCERCGRTGRIVVERKADGSIRSEIVQTAGPDPAEAIRAWWPRRELPGDVPDQEHRS